MNITKVRHEYDILQAVYLKHDPDNTLRMVTQITVTPIGIVYTLTCGETNSTHYEQEITTEPVVKLEYNYN
jgi:hypothetical protein